MGSAFPPDASAAVAVDDSDAGWAARAREVLAQADARLARRYGPDADIDRLLALRARAVDELLRQAWQRCLPAGAPLASGSSVHVPEKSGFCANATVASARTAAAITATLARFMRVLL